MRKGFKKMIAWACAMTLLVSGMAITPNTSIEAETTADGWVDASDVWTTDGVWNIWAGNGASARFQNNDTLEDYYVNTIAATGQWSVQTNTIVEGLTAGVLYEYTITIESDKDGAYVGAKDDITNSNLVYKSLVAGENQIIGTFTAGGEGKAKLFLEMGEAANNNATFHITGVEVKPYEVSVNDGNLVEGMKWQGWFEAEGWSSYEISTEASGYTLTNKNIGPNWYSIQTGIDNVAFAANTDYTCTFTITATNPKQFKVDNRSNDATIFVEKTPGSWTDNGDGTYSYKYYGTYASAAASVLNVRIALGYFGATETEYYASGSSLTCTVSDFQIVKSEDYEGEVPTEAPTEEPSSEEQTTVEEPTEEETSVSTGYDWVAISDGYSYNSDTTASIVNIQQPGFAAERGIYMNVPAGIDAVTVNGVSAGAGAIQGAGVVVYLSALTKNINEVVIAYAGGEATVMIKNDNVAPGGEVETTTPSGEVETTTPSGDSWVAISDGYSYNSDTTASIVNIQQPGFANESGIYMNVPAGIDAVTVNGVADGVGAIQGAGVVVYLSALTKNINEVVITYAGGEAIVKIKNDNVTSSGPVVDENIEIAGWQVAAGNVVANGTTYDGGIRTVYNIPAEIDGQSTEGAEVGLVYGFGGKATDDDMVVGGASDYVVSVAATAAGKIADGQYAMIMASNLGKANANAISQVYLVRAYVKIGGNYYYGDVASYSTYEVAEVLYTGSQGVQMPTAAGHAYVYNLLKKVTPNYGEVAWNANNSVAKAE